MRKRNWKRSFGVQRLEDRRLLAADVALELAPVESYEPEMCQVAELETQVESEDQGETLDLDATEIPVDVIENVGEEATTGEVVDVESSVDDEVVEQDESSIHDLGDPVDGTDGFFGSIDAENPEAQFTFSPSEAGMIDIVVASSFDGAETRLEVTDSAGELVTSTMAEDLVGFQKLTFEADAGETYQLNVSSEDGAEGYFQITVGHNEIPEPVDLHADSIGEDSTQLEIVDGSSELHGELELAGDTDTFQFTAESTGKALLALTELDTENATELQVQVLNVDGSLLTRGITNETVGVSFDVQEGGEYFLAISAGEGQTGSYGLELAFESSVVDAEQGTETVDSDPVDEVAVDEQPVDETVGDELAQDQPLDEEPVDDVVIGDVVIGDVAIDDVAIDDVAIDDVSDETVIEDAAEVVVDGEVVDEAVVDEVAVDEVAVDEVAVDNVAVDDFADDQPVDESEVDQQPVDDLIVDDSIEECIDESPVDQPIADQPIEVEVISDQSVDVQPDDEVVDVVDVVDNDEVVDVIAVDQVDDIPAVFDSGDSSTEEIDSEIDPIDNEIEDDLAGEPLDVSTESEIEDDITEEFDGSDVVSIDDLIDEENEICFTDLFLSEGDTVDAFFAEFNPDSIFQVRRGFGLRG